MENEGSHNVKWIRLYDSREAATDRVCLTAAGINIRPDPSTKHTTLGTGSTAQYTVVGRYRYPTRDQQNADTLNPWWLIDLAPGFNQNANNPAAASATTGWVRHDVIQLQGTVANAEGKVPVSWPPAPDVTVSQTGNLVEISWPPLAVPGFTATELGLAGYRILRSTTASGLADHGALVPHAAATTRYTWSESLQHGQFYWYAVAALSGNVKGLSSPAVIRSYTVPPPVMSPPGVPRQVAVSVSTETVTVTWQAPDAGGDVTGYWIWRGDSPDNLDKLRRVGTATYPNAVLISGRIQLDTVDSATVHGMYGSATPNRPIQAIMSCTIGFVQVTTARGIEVIVNGDGFPGSKRQSQVTCLQTVVHLYHGASPPWLTCSRHQNGNLGSIEVLYVLCGFLVPVSMPAVYPRRTRFPGR